jgi:hypothetical protein
MILAAPALVVRGNGFWSWEVVRQTGTAPAVLSSMIL